MDFEMKGVGPSDSFLGGNFNYTDENWANEKSIWVLVPRLTSRM